MKRDRRFSFTIELLSPEKRKGAYCTRWARWSSGWRDRLKKEGMVKTVCQRI